MTQICIRVDEEVKAAAEAVCDELGLSLSAAINIYLKKMGREKRIPFDLSVEPVKETRLTRQQKTSGGNSVEDYDIIR